MTSPDPSGDATLTRNLSLRQQERLSQLLEQYMSAMEQGDPPSLDSLVGAETDLLAPLRDCVSGLRNLHRLATGIAPESVDWSAGDPKRLGDFVLHEVIGRGGMGLVYRADQVSLQRCVALKLLPIAPAVDARQIARFRNEANAAANLQHPNIVPVYAVGCERGIHYYAMQLIEGESIEQIIARRAREALETDSEQADWREAVALAVDVADGLHAAHQQGVIHRDIKPSNLILDTHGKIWITDFGLAQCQNEVSLTGSTDVVGTLRYMSPEQARGDSAIVDGRTDVYSLAVTLYEMLSLCPAHDGEDAADILRNLDTESIIPLRQHRSDLPRDLETVIAKAMARHRDARYETAAELAMDLHRVLMGEPTIARPPTRIDRIANWGNRHRRAVLTAAAVVALACVGFGISTAKIAAEKNIADANSARALRYEQLSRRAVDRLGTQMAELLAEIPAARAVRRQLLDQTLHYYQQFAREAADDPDLQHDLALTLGKMGALQDELGDNTTALRSLAEAERIFASLAITNDDPQITLRWSVSQNNLAEGLRSNGRLAEASVWFDKAVANQQRLVSSTPPSAEAVVQLATSLNNLGLLETETGRVEQASEAYHRAIALLDDAQDQSLLQSTIQANLAGLLSKQSPQQAADYARRALARQIAEFTKSPGDASLATQVVSTLNTLGTAESKLSRHRAATDTFQRAVDIGQQLHTRWPDQPTYCRDLAISWNHLGLATAATGRLSEAKHAFEQALQYQQLLADKFHDDAEMLSLLGGVLNNLGFLQRQLGDEASAQQSFRRAVESQTAAIELAPEVARYQTFLKKHQRNLAAAGGRS